MENQDEVASTVKYAASAEKVGNGQFLSFFTGNAGMLYYFRF